MLCPCNLYAIRKVCPFGLGPCALACAIKQLPPFSNGPMPLCFNRPLPRRAQVTVLDLSTHVIQNMTRRGFEALAQLTGLRDLTLVNSSTVSSAGPVDWISAQSLFLTGP